MQRIIGLLIGVLFYADVAHAIEYDDILLAPKAYFDDGKDAEVVAFSGTLSGEEFGPKITHMPSLVFEKARSAGSA